MPVPELQSLFLPLLRLTADGAEHALRDLRQQLQVELQLTDDDLVKRIAGGQSKFGNRVSWGAVNLCRGGALERLGQGVFRITPRGRDLLQQHPEGLGLEDLVDTAKRGVSPEPGANESIGESPEERMERSDQQLRRALADELLEATRKCSWAFFENLVVKLLVAMGYGGPNGEGGRTVGRGADGGIDGIIQADKLGLETVYVQAKKWKDTVGRPTVQAFAGSLDGRRARKGVIITTSEFSKDALEYVNTIEKKIALIDGHQLAELMMDHGVGVTPGIVYHVQRLDHDYFEEM